MAQESQRLPEKTETEFCCREKGERGLCRLYLIPSWQQLGYRKSAFRGFPPTGVPLLQIPPVTIIDTGLTNRATQGTCLGAPSENELLL